MTTTTTTTTTTAAAAATTKQTPVHNILSDPIHFAETLVRPGNGCKWMQMYLQEDKAQETERYLHQKTFHKEIQTPYQ
jgi:hypothetical protein